MSLVLVAVEHRVVSFLHQPHVSLLRLVQALQGLRREPPNDLQHLGHQSVLFLHRESRGLWGGLARLHLRPSGSLSSVMLKIKQL